MNPEKFVGIMLLTLLLSCELEEPTENKIGEVSFETNQHIMNSAFDIDIYIDGKRIENKAGSSNNEKLLTKKLIVGIHNYEIKIYSFDGVPGKTLKGRFVIEEGKTAEIYIDFRNYNSWI